MFLCTCFQITNSSYWMIYISKDILPCSPHINYIVLVLTRDAKWTRQYAIISFFKDVITDQDFMSILGMPCRVQTGYILYLLAAFLLAYVSWSTFGPMTALFHCDISPKCLPSIHHWPAVTDDSRCDLASTFLLLSSVRIHIETELQLFMTEGLLRNGFAQWKMIYLMNLVLVNVISNFMVSLLQ